jgi:hypothetical protein
MGQEFTAAELDIQIDYWGIVGGKVQGDGTLIATHLDESKTSVPVRLEGGSAGATMNVASTFAGKLVYSFEDDTVMGEDLLGLFEVVAMSGTLLVGAVQRRMTNEAGVELAGVQANGGFGIHLAAEWLFIEFGTSDRI